MYTPLPPVPTPNDALQLEVPAVLSTLNSATSLTPVVVTVLTMLAAPVPVVPEMTVFPVLLIVNVLLDPVYVIGKVVEAPEPAGP